MHHRAPHMAALCALATLLVVLSALETRARATPAPPEPTRAERSRGIMLVAPHTLQRGVPINETAGVGMNATAVPTSFTTPSGGSNDTETSPSSTSELAFSTASAWLAAISGAALFVICVVYLYHLGASP
jgi:Flp pilus assembly protein CpaB